MRKRILGLVLITVVGFAWMGCQASSGGAGEGAKVRVDVAPNLSDYDVHKVAILGFVNLTGDPKADRLADDVTRALFQSGKYQFTTAGNFAADAKRVGEQSDYDRCMETWRKRRVMDGEKLTRLLEATGQDALLAIEINKWSEEKIGPNQEGTSNTSVGLKLKLFAPDGTVLWSASQLKVKKSPPYFPDFNTRATIGGEARTTSAGAVPDPPPIEKVAVETANEVVEQLPLIRKGAAADTSKAP